MYLLNHLYVYQKFILVSLRNIMFGYKVFENFLSSVIALKMTSQKSIRSGVCSRYVRVKFGVMKLLHVQLSQEDNTVRPCEYQECPISRLATHLKTDWILIFWNPMNEKTQEQHNGTSYIRFLWMTNHRNPFFSFSNIVKKKSLEKNNFLHYQSLWIRKQVKNTVNHFIFRLLWTRKNNKNFFSTSRSHDTENTTMKTHWIITFWIIMNGKKKKSINS